MMVQLIGREVFITPKMAANWLARNTHNRPLRRNLVSRYAQEIKAGNWRRHHQGIAINCDGTILDGQHRLHAIVEAGVGAWMMVTEGVEMSSQIAIDDHAKRTPFDSLILEGTVTKLDAHMVVVAAGLRLGWSNGAVSKSVIAAILKEHEQAIRFACESLWGGGSKRGITQGTIAVVVARAWYSCDPNRLKEFCHILRTGEGVNSDVAAVTLRNWLLSTVQRFSAKTKTEVYRKTERMLKAFVELEPLRKCIASSDELFPIVNDPCLVKT